MIIKLLKFGFEDITISQARGMKCNICTPSIEMVFLAHNICILSNVDILNWIITYLFYTDSLKKKKHSSFTVYVHVRSELFCLGENCPRNIMYSRTDTVPFSW